MAIEMIPLHREMITQATTLEGVTSREVKDFATYLGIVAFSDNGKPDETQTAAYKKISAMLEECPRTRLAITIVKRDLRELLHKPRGNARLYGLSKNFFPKIRVEDYVPKDNPGILWGVEEMKHEPPLEVAIDSSIGMIVSGDWRFRLYGRFKDYADPKLVSKNMGHGYPIETMNRPEKETEIDLRVFDGFVPTLLFVGNRLEICNHALVYVGHKYWDPPDNFHQFVEHQAGWFAMDHLTSKDTIMSYEAVKRLNAEIAELEALVRTET